MSFERRGIVERVQRAMAEEEWDVVVWTEERQQESGTVDPANAREIIERVIALYERENSGACQDSSMLAWAAHLSERGRNRGAHS